MNGAGLDRGIRGMQIGAALITAALWGALAAGVPVGIPGQWVWSRNDLPVRLWPAVAAGLVLIGIVFLMYRPELVGREGPLRGGRALVLLVAAVFLLQMALLNAAGVPLLSPSAIIASPVATTYYSVSLELKDLREWVRTYPEHMAGLPYHARTHPPGFVLLFLLVRCACQTVAPRPPAVFAELAEALRQFGIGPSATDALAAVVSPAVISLLGALSLWPLSLLARELAGGTVGHAGTVLAGSIPALLVFGASPDLVALLATVLALWLGYSAWRRDSLPRALLAGVVSGIGLFLTFGLLALMGWVWVWLALGLLSSADRRAAARRAARVAAGAAVGIAGYYLVLYLSLGYRPFAVARQALFAHHGVTTAEAARSYLAWVLMDPVETAVFLGLPLAVAAVWAGIRLRRDPGLGRLRLFLVSWLVTVALLDLSGTVRGEVGRIWLFLMWPAALVAGAGLGENRGRAAAALVALQMAQAILMRHYLTFYMVM